MFWYNLFRYDAICQFQVTRSVMTEWPIQIRSHILEYDYHHQLIECRLIMIRVPDLAGNDRLQHTDHDQLRSVAIGCGFCLTAFTITIESDHDLSHDWTRRVQGSSLRAIRRKISP